jgi:hypothetical protein
MSTVRRPATAWLGALACALLLWPLPAPASGASSASQEALLAQERYLSTFPVPEPAGEPSPEERYYASYGEPAPLMAPGASAPSGEAPSVVLAVACGAAGSLVLIGLTRSRRSRVAPRPRARTHARGGAA